MTAAVDHAADREQRARDLIDRGYTPGRVAEMTGMPLGAVDRLSARPLEPVTGPYATPHVVPIRERTEPPLACAWGLGCTRPVTTDGHCELHHAVIEAAAAKKPAAPPAIRQPTPQAQGQPTPAPKAVRDRPTPAPKPSSATPARPSTCAAPGCDQPRNKTKKLCVAHTARMRKYGSLALPASRTAHCAAGHDWQAPMKAGPAPARCPEHDGTAVEPTSSAGTPERPPRQARRSPTSPLRIELSAGYVELTAHVDFFTLSEPDVAWLLDLRRQLFTAANRSAG